MFLYLVATAPTVYGIETISHFVVFVEFCTVATALTVYGIETSLYFYVQRWNRQLQQHLPFIVLNLVCLIWDTYDILSVIMMFSIMEIQ